MKKALLLGGTGALGYYLTPSLLELGFKVDVVSLDDMISNRKDLKYIKADCKNVEFLENLVKNEYDVIVDFLIYFSPEEFGKYYKIFLQNCEHYIFLSSYRIYADCKTPLTENSPRLLDVSTDKAFLSSGDYAIYKAQEEDMLKNSGYNNWTVLRPAITYSKGRYQLVTLEARVLVYRMLRNRVVILPEPAMNISATMSWAGDFGKTVARLALNRAAYKECYTISTSEHHTWEEIAKLYTKLGGLKYITVDTETYLNMLSPGNIFVRQQLTHDRYFNRMVDNTKLLNATGLKQSDFMPLEEGLKTELAKATIENTVGDMVVNARMDEYLKNM